MALGRPRKRLVDVVRQETFLARQHHRLLGDREPLPWPGLDGFRRRYLAQGSEKERREVALELERAIREHGSRVLLGDLQAELRRLGPPKSYRQLERFFPRFFKHSRGPSAGQPFNLDGFQRAFLREFWRRDGRGERIYQVGCLGIPKGNGKTPLAAALGTHALVSQLDDPEVYGIAGSRDQAGIAHGFASKNIRDAELAAWLDIGSSITCVDHDGFFDILSSEGDLGHGTQPSAAIVDEWWQFRHRAQREAYTAQAQALHKRPGEAWLLAITTAGWDIGSQLGETYQAAVADPRLELHDDGSLMVLRDESAGMLFWWYGAPDDAAIDDPKVIRRANPLRIVRPQDLLRELRRPDTDENDWVRLHLNRWTKARTAWMRAGIWAGLRADVQIPVGAEITVGIDAARSFDTTTVAWAWRAPDGRRVLRSHVWSVRQQHPHHTFVPGGELVNEELVEPYIEQLAAMYRVREIGFDPRFFSAEARHLSNQGFNVVELYPQSAPMGDAVTAFEKAALDGQLSHDGDQVLAAHIDAVDAVRTDGGTKIRRTGRRAIDAAVACVIANYLTEQPAPVEAAAWRPL